MATIQLRTAVPGPKSKALADRRLRAVPCVEAADSARKIDEAISIDIFQNRCLGASDVDRSGVRESARNGCISALRKRF